MSLLRRALDAVSGMIRTRRNPLRMLDNLPPELLSQVLSHLKPQEMLVFSTSSRRWCGTDYELLYWKPAFLNAFALDPREAAQRPTRGRKARSLWRDRYERAWRFRLEPGTCALGLQLERPFLVYEPRSLGPDVIPEYWAGDPIDVGVLTVRDIKGKNKELRYYVHSEGVAWGPEDVDVDVWLDLGGPWGPGEDDGRDEYSIHEGIMKGCVVYESSSATALYDPTRPAVGRRGVRVGSPLRHLLEAFCLSLDDVISMSDSRCGWRFRLRGVDNFDFGLGSSDDRYSAEDQWEPIPHAPEVPTATREEKLNWPLQTIQIWSAE